MTPEEIVRRGYDAAAERYASARDLDNLLYLPRFSSLLPPPAAVLDVGCGSGRPIDAWLVARGYDLTGIDLSSRQIELAQQHVPDARYEVRDMLDLAPGEYRVDGLVSFYAIFHTPRGRHAELLQTLRSFLPSGGPLLITMGASRWEGTEPDFFGVQMYWSHFDSATNRPWSRRPGSPLGSTRSRKPCPVSGIRSSWPARAEIGGPGSHTCSMIQPKIRRTWLSTSDRGQ